MALSGRYALGAARAATGLTAMAATLAGCQGQPSVAASQAVAEETAGALAVEPTGPAGPPPMQGNAADNPDMTGVAAAVDTNGDGKMSAAEWQAQGLPKSSFKAFEKGRGYVTLKDYQDNPAPPGIDLDGDGRVTVAEFKEFDKQMAARMKDAPPPPPPAS